MTIALAVLTLAFSQPYDRGGHAVAIPPPRGGHAVTAPEPVRWLKRFSDWVCIHGREASWTADTGNGYHGGLQMDWSFMRAYGADALRRHGGRGAEAWTPAEQIVVAERAYRSGRGFGPWPNTARACGFSTGRVARDSEPLALPLDTR